MFNFAFFNRNVFRSLIRMYDISPTRDIVNTRHRVHVTSCTHDIVNMRHCVHKTSCTRDIVNTDGHVYTQKATSYLALTINKYQSVFIQDFIVSYSLYSFYD